MPLSLPRSSPHEKSTTCFPIRGVRLSFLHRESPRFQPDSIPSRAIILGLLSHFYIAHRTKNHLGRFPGVHTPTTPSSAIVNSTFVVRSPWDMTPTNLDTRHSPPRHFMPFCVYAAQRPILTPFQHRSGIAFSVDPENLPTPSYCLMCVLL